MEIMDSNNRKRKILILQITEACNLKCAYCYQHCKTDSFMQLGMAKQSIQKHIANSDEFDEIEIEFFGGEPFLQFDFIREICEWTWAQRFKKPIIFFCSTNGTLIHGEIQTWLKKHSHKIWVGLSLDGTRG